MRHWTVSKLGSSRPNRLGRRILPLAAGAILLGCVQEPTPRVEPPAADPEAVVGVAVVVPDWEPNDGETRILAGQVGTVAQARFPELVTLAQIDPQQLDPSVTGLGTPVLQREGIDVTNIEVAGGHVAELDEGEFRLQLAAGVHLLCLVAESMSRCFLYDMAPGHRCRIEVSEGDRLTCSAD